MNGELQAETSMGSTIHSIGHISTTKLKTIFHPFLLPRSDTQILSRFEMIPLEISSHFIIVLFNLPDSLLVESKIGLNGELQVEIYHSSTI